MLCNLLDTIRIVTVTVIVALAVVALVVWIIREYEARSSFRELDEYYNIKVDRDDKRV